MVLPLHVHATYNLPLHEKFTVLTNDTVGLYSGDNAFQILTSSSSSGTVISYSITGNHSNISTVEDGLMLEQSIVVQISEHFCCYNNYMHACI